ncbi:SDR family oxidoreductase [Lentzea sp. NEAU-D7]|uniref:SDR family oxidoreductase n=1 Tax=Lentzea sp. NEAU-D7 TaxID=2994667 RepID=UPI00224A74F5|nr:SDR family oxidoreductase [Lentzea sp. NEAU-D7]MCX2954717.1 SDR family oxidoreductase [Lentzea sp. NEAU-D7]
MNSPRAGAFADRICLVTGGSKGQGRAIARELARGGGHVIVNWFHDIDAARQTVADILAEGGSAEHLRASVAKQDAVEEMFAEVARRHGRLDVLVNNAARGVFEPGHVLTDRDWERAIDTNVHGPRRCCRAAFPLMKERGGAIVNLGSIGTSVVIDNYSCVAVCKGALEQLTKYLAVEFGPHGIRVNMASAGMLVSKTVELFPRSEEVLEATVAGTPLGRLGTVEEHAKLVAFLASPEASWMTGENVVNDGGIRLGGALIRAGGTWGDAARPAAALAGPGVPVDSASANAPDRVSEAASGSAPVRASNSVPVRTSGRAAGNTPDRAEDDGAIAVVGMGLVVPGAESPEQFWELLRTGEPAFSEPGDRYPQDTFWAGDPGDRDRTYARTAGFVRMGRHEDVAPDASLSSSWLRHALEQALPDGPSSRSSLFIGACSDGDQHFEQAMVVEGYARLLAENWPSPSGPDAERLRPVLRERYRLAAGSPEDHLPDGVVRNAVRGLLPDTTPVTVVDTACSSSLYAIDLGVAALREGSTDLALCGGYFMVTPRFNVLFSKLGGLSHRGAVNAFDGSADGTLFSDGAAVVALRRLADARRDGQQVLGVLAGFGAAADGRGKAIAAPNRRGQELAIARAGHGRERHPVWVVGHGTGTRAGDEVELAALNESAAGREVLCTSNKSLIGHTGWAAGAVSVIHALLALRHDVVPAQRPQPGAAATAEHITVPMRDTPLPAGPRLVGVSGFGFGGTNGHLLLRDEPGPGESVPAARRPAMDDRIVLVAWSAHLPGAPASAEVAARLGDGRAPADDTGFPLPYPAPEWKVSRLPAAVSDAVDRTQLMALDVAERFLAEHGHLWEGREETTGVVAAHYGPTLSWYQSALRCYADDLLAVTPGELDPDEYAEAARAAGRAVRAGTPEFTPDTQPGLMGNVIASRIANRHNLNGAVQLADAGPDATAHALQTAVRHLRGGTLDLALVLSLNGNSTDELRALLGRGPLGEGAFLFALARESTAAAARWPVLCEISVATGGAEARAPRPVDYLGANGACDLIGELARLRETPRVVAGGPSAPGIVLTPHRATRPAPRNERYVCTYVEEPAPDAEWTTAPGSDWLVVVQPGCEESVPARVRESGAHVRVLDESAPVEAQFPDAATGAGRFSHVRLFASTGGSAPGEAVPEGTLRAHEALFLAAKSCRDRIDAGGSLGVHLVDELRSGVPHSSTGLFTGIVSSLAWDLRGARLAVVISSEAGGWETLNRELAGYRGYPAVLHHDGVRLRTKLVPAPLDLSSNVSPLRPGSVVVVTGGARGITAACAKELAARTPLRLWLLGSSRLQDVPDELLDAGAEQLPGLRAAFLQAERARTPGATVREVMARFDRLLNARESQRNLRELRALCGEDAVDYLTCDLTDAEAVRSTVEAIRQVTPDVDLLVHGAGLHNGGDISRLTIDGLRHVRGVKVDGYRNLKAAFGTAQPAQWCNFGSVAGLVGLPGETDYAPGNDFLHGAARQAALVRGADERTLIWPIWAEIGMGGSELMQGNNERAGIMAPLAPAEGVRHLATELSTPSVAQPLVAFLNAKERATFGEQFPGFVHPVPERTRWMLGTPHRITRAATQWLLDLGERTAGFLVDHTVNGKPTMHGTGLATIAAEAATAVIPGSPVRTLENLRFSAFVAPKAGPGNPYRVTARLDGPDRVHVRITSDVVDRRGRVLRADREHFACDVVLGSLPVPPPARSVVTDRLSEDPYYREDSAVVLRGVYRASTDGREGPDGTSSVWVLVQAGTEADHALLENPPVPTVMLDALARTRLLRTDGNGVHLVAVPRFIDRIEFFTTGSDATVSKSHPDGIRLIHVDDANVEEAVSADGRVLIRISGCETFDVGDTS